jgi:hypothetical protein
MRVSGRYRLHPRHLGIVSASAGRSRSPDMNNLPPARNEAFAGYMILDCINTEVNVA